MNTLTLTMGLSVETMIESFNLSDDDQNMYSFVVECVHKYYTREKILEMRRLISVTKRRTSLEASL